MLKNFSVAPDLKSNLFHKVNMVQRRGELRYFVTDFPKEDRVLIEIDHDDHRYKVAVLGGQWCIGQFEVLVFMRDAFEDEGEDPWMDVAVERYSSVGEVQAALYHLFNALADGDSPSLPYFDPDGLDLNF